MQFLNIICDYNFHPLFWWSNNNRLELCTYILLLKKVFDGSCSNFYYLDDPRTSTEREKEIEWGILSKWKQIIFDVFIFSNFVWRKFQYFSSWNNYGFVPSTKCREKVKIIDILMNILRHVLKNNVLQLNTLNGSQYGLCMYIS